MHALALKYSLDDYQFTTYSSSRMVLVLYGACFSFVFSLVLSSIVVAVADTATVFPVLFTLWLLSLILLKRTRKIYRHFLNNNNKKIDLNFLLLFYRLKTGIVKHCCIDGYHDGRTAVVITTTEWKNQLRGSLTVCGLSSTLMALWWWVTAHTGWNRLKIVPWKKI